MNNFPGATNLGHPETNPHFEPSSRQTPPQLEGDHYPAHLGSWGLSPPPPRQPRQQAEPLSPPLWQPQNRGQQPGATQWEPREREREQREPRELERERERQRDPRKKSKQTTLTIVQPPGSNLDRQPRIGGPGPRVTSPQHHQGQHPSGLSPSHGSQVPQKERQGFRQPRPHSPSVLSPEYHNGREGLIMPRRQKTNWLTWFAAVFCAIFWVIVILGGLIVLIVYLVFRPRSPRFDVSSATLNAAYLDMGSLLNADLTVLANFTNPNKRVSVDFSSVTLDLIFGHTLIATQYIEPFKATKAQSLFANVHMVTSQVQLSLQERELLKRQIANNRVLFEVKGIFHARSVLGNFLGYSYRLYSTCQIEVTSPPTGVLRVSKCKTKR